MTRDIRLSLVAAALLQVAAAVAQTSELGRNLWTAQQNNELWNVKYNSANPTRISSNRERNAAFARADYTLTRGDFHAIDQSGRQNELNVYFGGLKQLKKVDLYGSLRYDNQQAKDRAWNSTYGLEPTNPFTIADSIAGKSTTEAFQLEALASYTINERWKMGLGIDIHNASFSDQIDPRPKVNTTVIPVTLGTDWQVSSPLSLGLAVGVRFYNSDMSYTRVNNRVGHQFFLMKGMGDNMSLSSNSEASYRRDYHGFAYQAALQAAWHRPEGRWHDFLQLQAERGTQDATDGGSSYTFKGGDYAYTRLGIQDRLQFQPNDKRLHQWTIAASMLQGEGTWYDQKRITDTEHNNRVDYTVLGKTKAHKPSLMTGDISYRLHFLNEQTTRLSVGANVGMEHASTKHLTDAGTRKQSYTRAHLQVDARDEIALRRGRLNLALGAGLWMPVGDKKFASATEATAAGTLITRDYVNPLFAYETAQFYRVAALVDYCLPLHHGKLGLGLYGKVRCDIYGDDATYTDIYTSTTLTTMQVGVYLKF
ncbi:MAG: hypothetical protein IJT19_01215 [Bacteroidaceae bacterium]|nr:hypothetical protein [Bacteroidaceae bacterium]